MNLKYLIRKYSEDMKCVSEGFKVFRSFGNYLSSTFSQYSLPSLPPPSFCKKKKKLIQQKKIAKLVEC